MKKQDIAILVALVALLLLWSPIDRHVIKPLVEKYFPGMAERARPAPVATIPVTTNESGTVAEAPERAMASEAAAVPPAMITPVEKPEYDAPEQRVAISNDMVSLTFSTHGGALVEARMHEYRATVKKDSGPMAFSLTNFPALAYGRPTALQGISYRIVRTPDIPDGTLVMEGRAQNGLTVRRTFRLTDGYLLEISDAFINSADEDIPLESAAMQLGAMQALPGVSTMRGRSDLGADALSTLGSKVYHHRHGGLTKPFKSERELNGLTALPRRVIWTPKGGAQPVEWISVKNKYFAQILTPEIETDRMQLICERALTPTERETGRRTLTKNPHIETIAAEVHFPAVTVPPGERFALNATYYFGPKKFRILKSFAQHQVDIMNFGWAPPIAKILLPTLNTIYRIIPNYGIAIMLLTIIIKILFYPITKKGTKSMRRMQEIQPLIAEMKEKYKKDPQRQQQEMMKLYKEHKVNPVGGCLPMLIQIPVFISLFYVLRTAIELRFSEFLWIRDLSEPERLIEFGFALPLIGWDALNTLPFLMAVTMIWQQRLMPSSADAQQQKMMGMMMPIMMLLFLYNMASGLILYWTTNQCLSIAEQLLHRWRKKKEAPA